MGTDQWSDGRRKWSHSSDRDAKGDVQIHHPGTYNDIIFLFLSRLVVTVSPYHSSDVANFEMTAAGIPFHMPSIQVPRPRETRSQLSVLLPDLLCTSVQVLNYQSRRI